MNTAKTAFIAISLFVYTTLSGQSDFGKVTFQSPNSSDFQMYGNVPVGHYTGVPNISIPLYEVKDASLNVPISLSYHSSSVKVNKHSGWVGLGWTLKAGGVITRIQNQLPDEQESNHTFSPGFYEQHHVLDYPDWYTSANLQDYAIQQSVATGIGSFESAPDEFQFNFLSYSGSFIMDHKGEWKVISDHNIRVEFDETTGFLDAQNLPDRIIDAGYPNLSTVNGSPFHQFNRYFHEFTLITPDGTRYTFGGDNAVEYNVNFRNQLAGYILAQAWYLKKIKGRNGEEIDFVYEEGKLVCALNRSRTYNKVDFNSAPGALSLDCNKTFDNRIAVPEESNIGGTVIFPVYLSQIEAETEIINFHSSPTNDLNYELMNDPNTFYDFWPTCNTSSWQGNCPVYFDFLDWSAFEWVKLDRISVTKKLGGYFKGFNFGYINSPHERLKLTSVQETGKITGPYQYATKPPYEFEYNAEMLPNYLSDDVDHWGFYNGYSAHTWGAAHSNPDILNGWYDINTKYLDLPMSEWAPYYFNSRETWLNGNGDQYAKAEVLERITYPTGGFTEFEFEQNTYSQVVSKDRQSLEMVKTSESQPLATNIVSISRGTCDIYPVLGSPFKGSDLINAKASLEVIRCSNEDYTNSTDPVFSLVLEEVAPGSNIVIDTYNGYQHDDHYINENMALSYFFPGVTGLDPIKTYRIVSPEPITVGPFHPGLRFNVYHEGGIKKAGGLRIKSIKSYPSVSEDPIIKTYDYGQEFAGNIAGSSGILGNKVQYWWDNYTAESTDGDQIEYDYFTSSNQLSPGDNGQGGHIGYSKVTERQEGANGKTLGKTEYQFTNYDQDVWGNYHLDELAINWMDVERSVYAPYSSTSFERGKPIKISWYNNSGDLLKDIKYKYQRSTNDYLRMIDLEEINLCGPGKLPMHFGSAYKRYLSRYNLTETMEGEYFQGSSPVWTTKRFKYENDLLVEESIMNSDGVEHITSYKFPIAYNLTTVSSSFAQATKALENANVEIPIETLYQIKKPNEDRKTISGTLMEFGLGTNGNQLRQIWHTEMFQPQANFLESDINSSGLLVYAPQYKVEGLHLPKQIVDRYDSKGNILEFHEQFGIKNSFIWAENADLPLAKAKNAAYNDFRYHGFDEYMIGGWHNVPNNTQLNIDGKAGKCIKIHDQNYPETTLIPEAQFSPFTLEVFVRSNADNNGELLVKILRENGTLLTEIRQGFQNTNANKWVLQSLELDLGTIRSNNAIPSTEKMTLQASVSWLTASFEIDEFRLNPSKARLETYVYNGFGQLIAKSDVNGYMTHYDYDDLHRLKATSDDENNITSVNFYKYPSNTVTHNHIISGTAIVEGITDPNAIYYGQGMLRSKKYYDGLGRPLQIVNLNQSPSNKDVVQIYEYDAFGRETKEYLPFTDISNGGQFRSNAKLLQNIFYGSIANAFAYSEMQYDSAAIQIPIMAGAPGTSWFIGSGHEKLISFRSCNTPDVRMFDVHGNSNATFWAGSLKAEMSMDEDGNLSTIYYDKLKRKLMTDNEGAKTYFIHDDFGRLKFVIPPKAFAQMETANNFNCNAYLDGIYSYTYDAKGRIIRKDLPGKEEEIIYYDRLDRSVLTIDANSNKIFTKYDALGRPIIAGLYHGLSIPSTSDGLYEIEVSGNIGYTTNLTFPESNLEIQSINYYDHYDLDRDGTISSQEDYKVCTNTLYQNEKSNRVFGMLTASKSLLLDGSNRFITTQTFYDKKGRVIQTKAENSLDGADISYFNYEFSGTLLNDRREHRVVLNGATKSLVVENRYTYDHTRSRLIDTFQTINGGLETHISKNTYNEQDLLKRKSLGVSNGNALQDIDYKYNIRGWLTDINNVYDRSNGFNKLPVIGQQKGFGKQ